MAAKIIETFDPVVWPDHFEYLVLQKGKLADLAHDRTAWTRAYREALVKTYQSIAAVLPEKCASVLDVGSGLGGIDILLNRHFGGGLEVCLLDGEDDAPKMNLHRQTFNSMKVAEDFLRENDVTRFSYYAADKLGDPRPFDLIVSFGSWCFHYAPAVYLEFVKACCHKDTVLVIELRNDKLSWLRELNAVFAHDEIVRTRKFTRLVLRPL